MGPLQVVCYDHQAKFGMISVPWPTMQGYLLGIVDGHQLGWAVQKVQTPAP